MAIVKNEPTSQDVQHNNGHNRSTNESTPLVANANNALICSSTYDEEKQQQRTFARNNKDDNKSDNDHVNDDDTNNNLNKNEQTPKIPVSTQSLKNITWDEGAQMIRLAVPVIGTYLLEILPGVVSIVLVGHVPNSDNRTKECVDATALAVMLFNVLGLYVGFGLAAAMDTLCSQAYGANELFSMGTYLQTGILVLSITYCIVLIPLWNAADFLVALGQPALVSEMAGTFVHYLIPGLPFLYLYELIRKVLQAQNIALPMLYVSIFANTMNIVVGYYLVYHTSYGWLGAAIARTICNVCFLLAMLIYLFSSGLHSTFWTGWNIKNALKGSCKFISLGIPGMLQLCFEWWAFEMLSVLSGILPNAEVAIGAHAVILSITSITYMFYWGVATAGNVRIGNALGAGSILRARVAAYLTIGIVCINAIICGLVLSIFSTSLPKLFTNEEEIDKFSTKLLYIAAVFQIFDANNGAVQGIFRGTGRQMVGAQLNLVAYYIVGVPLGALLAFKYKLNIMGLWMGITMGLFVIAVCGNVLIYRSNWYELADEARRRIAQ